jgi:hypothetical protein
MKKLGLAGRLSLLALLPLVGGCYAYVPAQPYYARHYYRPSRVYVSPAYVPPPVVVAPPRVRVYW